MSWIFSQAMMQDYANSHSLQGQGGESSAVNCLDGEPFAQLNVMPTQAKFWRNDKMMEFCDLSRFGLTLQLLTESRGEELLTWFLAGFRAKTLAQQEKAQELKVNEAECGKKWHGLLAKYDQATCSWKTAQCSLLEDLEQSLETWPRWGSMRNGACYLRPMLAHLTSEKESGLLEETWPTPRSCTAMQANITVKTASAKFQNLETVVARKIHKMPNWSDQDLINLAMKVSGIQTWPTPDANMGSRGTQPEWQPIRKSGQTAQYTINQAVRDSEQNDGGRLNPTWVEWLMGWPLQWTDLKPSAMVKCHFALQQHLSCLEQGLSEAA